MRISDWSSDVCSSDLDGCNKNASSNNNAEKLKNEQMPVNLCADTSKNCRIIAPLLSRSPFKNPSRPRCKSTPHLHLHFVAIRRGRTLLQSGYWVATDRGQQMRSEERRVGKECVST